MMWLQKTTQALLLGSLLCVVSAGNASADGFEVIASHATTAMSAKDLKRVFTGQISRWPDGTPVVLVLPPKGSPAMAWACSTVLKMPESVYLRYVKEKVFRGSIAQPIEVVGEGEIIAMVAQHVGAVSIAPAGTASGAAHAVIVQ